MDAIEKGRVQHRLHGYGVTDGLTYTVDSGTREELVFFSDEVLVDGEVVEHVEWPTTVVAIHKPKNLNVIMEKILVPQSNLEGMGRKPCFMTWAEELETEIGSRRLFAIGRLDKKTTGLMFLTDDGDLSFRLCTPGIIKKTYVCTVNRHVTDDHVAQLHNGVELSDGFARALKVDLLMPVTVSESEPVINDAGLNVGRSGVPPQVPSASTVGGGGSSVASPPTHAATSGDALADVTPSGAAPTLSKKRQRKLQQKRDKEEKKKRHRSGVAGGGGEEHQQQQWLKSKVEQQLRVVVDMGRNRVVRRLVAAVGLPVMELHRTKIGDFDLVSSFGLDTPGAHVVLTGAQVGALWEAVGGRDSVVERKVEALRCSLLLDDDGGQQHQVGQQQRGEDGEVDTNKTVVVVGGGGEVDTKEEEETEQQQGISCRSNGDDIIAMGRRRLELWLKGRATVVSS